MKVEIKTLSVDIEGNVVMKDLSFTVEEHRSCIIVGSYGYYNGILLNVLGGFYEPHSGQVCIGGRDIYAKTEEEIIDLRRKISFVFQEGAFLSNLTVLENLLLPVKFYSKKFAKTRVMREIKDYCDYFNVPPVLEKRPAFISYTSKKILSLIRALITHPEIIIINKPLFNLDIRNQIKVIDLLKKIKQQGMTYIISSNSYDVIKGIADQVVHIEKDKIKKIYYARDEGFLEDIKKLDILSDVVGVEDEV